jgi:hypothetical protein
LEAALLGLPLYCIGKMEKDSVTAIDTKLLGEPELFRKINSQTQLFVRLFTEIGNAFPQQYLKTIHGKSKGIKVSKGNQLEELPYQVLDIIRDFDPKTGLNFRLLNWWGKGLYCFILYGSEAAKTHQQAIETLGEEFSVSLSPSKWDYAAILLQSKKERFDANLHLTSFDHCQIVQKIELIADYDQLKNRIINQIRQQLDIHAQYLPL